jgi:ferritin-like protein
MRTVQTGEIRRHGLLRKSEPRLPHDCRIKTVEQLREHLQTAIELELSTIPPYLCALYSIPDGTNLDAANVIRGVVMEEMLHTALAANVLNAIDGQPRINDRNVIPKYPGYLPHSNKAFKVNLERFSKPAIKTFRKIEKPGPPKSPPEPDNYKSIGLFYEAIELGLKELSEKGNIFTGDPSRQVTPESYYGGGGEIIDIFDGSQTPLKQSLDALEEIVGQGEGICHTIYDSDHVEFGQDAEYAHYFRFNEIHEGRYYAKGDKPNKRPTGAPLPVDWGAVYKMQKNPKMRNYRNNKPLWQNAYDFNRTYMTLLNVLHDAFNGQPDLLLNSVATMFDLKWQAIALMQMPIDGADGEMAGPSFEYVDLKKKR